MTKNNTEREREGASLEKHPKHSLELPKMLTSITWNYMCVRAMRVCLPHLCMLYWVCFPLQNSVRIECSIKLATHSNNDIYRYVIHSRERERTSERERETDWARNGNLNVEVEVEVFHGNCESLFTSNYHKSFIWIAATNLNRFSISKMKENRTSCIQFRFTLSYPFLSLRIHS